MSQKETTKTYLDVEDFQVYQKFCQLHLEIGDLSHAWPAEEQYALGSQIRRSSNSSPTQLTEKHDDRHVRNKVEEVNRSRGEAGETIHHLFMAKLKGYSNNDVYATYRERYKQCIRMLNGLEKSLKQRLPEKERRWIVAQAAGKYGEPRELPSPGWPLTEPRTLNA